MKVKFNYEGRNTFLISLMGGSLILFGYLLSGSYKFAFIAFYYIILAFVINLIVFISEIISAIIKKENRVAHINSAILLLVNIPIVFLYLFIFDKF